MISDILYNIISRRHERASTIITTNLAFKQWGTVFPGAACVVALVDRFAQHCHRPRRRGCHTANRSPRRR
jgi:DNA replication protein DnaC